MSEPVTRPWRAALLVSGRVVSTAGPWFATEAECVAYIADHVVGGGVYPELPDVPWVATTDLVHVSARLDVAAGGRFGPHAGQGFQWVRAPLAWTLVADPEPSPPLRAQVVDQVTDADGGFIALELAVPAADVDRLGEARPVLVRVYRPVEVARAVEAEDSPPAGRLLPRLPASGGASAAPRRPGRAPF